MNKTPLHRYTAIIVWLYRNQDNYQDKAIWRTEFLGYLYNVLQYGETKNTIARLEVYAIIVEWLYVHQNHYKDGTTWRLKFLEFLATTLKVKPFSSEDNLNSKIVNAKNT